jgi:hypothetical protein
MHIFLWRAAFAAIAFAVWPGAGPASGQETATDATVAQPAPPVEIPDEPKTVDPATLVPQQLAALATVDFVESSLGEVVKWLREEQKLAVLLDEEQLSDAGILVSEPVTDHLNNAPVYLLLNRLRALELAWYVRDDVVHITTAADADEHLINQPYNVGDLLDAEFEPEALIETIQNQTAGPWQDLDGIGGTMEMLGDVLFVRQTDEIHREVLGLLAALRKHARRTFTLDPPQHEVLRQKLIENVTVDFEDVPLLEATNDLARQTGADIRLDVRGLEDAGVRDRSPVSLTLTDRKLSTVLQTLLASYHATWAMRDGVLWITAQEKAEEILTTAVFDVRDLCRDDSESDALIEAIQNQTEGPWQDLDGIGGTMDNAKAGVLVVRQTEPLQQNVLELLQNYRTALLASKPRPRDVIDPNEVVTRYYRVEAAMADDLANLMRQLVLPDSWRSDQLPEAAGTIQRAVSKSDFVGDHVVAYSILIIRQTRAAHDEIAEFIGKIEGGDAPPATAAGIGTEAPAPAMGGFGGGGFGGGYFSPRPYGK